MKKEIITIDEKSGLFRITTLDERWYAVPQMDEETGLPSGYQYLPSSTWIASNYPKGIGFWKWLADKGWDEAQAIKEAAGSRGSKVHQVAGDLEDGKTIPLSSQYPNPKTGEPEEFTAEEMDCIVSFCKWHEKTNPKLIAQELTVVGDGYAGTLDKIYLIDGQIVIVDLKTSQNIWEEHRLQISSYSHANFDLKELGISEKDWEARKLAILQLGYRKNKNGYKFTEVEDRFDLFKVARQIWANENPDAKPKQRDYPLEIRLKREG